MQETDTTEKWEKPLSIEERTLPEWPKEVFPEMLDNFVNELSRFTETPIEMASILALATIAGASHLYYQVQVKEGYIEPINIWALAIMPPASRKTSVYKEITAPLKEWEGHLKILAEPEIKSSESHRKTMEARLKILRTQAAKANEIEYPKLQVQIEDFEARIPQARGYPQLWASDVTSEQLGVIMAANNEAMALLSDEGGIFDIISGLYSDGRSNIDLLLQAHSASSVRVDRGSRPPIFMNRPVLTMGLTIQPQVMSKISGNKTFRGRGLLGRFLYVLPKSNIGTRTLDVPAMSTACVKAFHEAMMSILNRIMSLGSPSVLHTLLLDESAYNKWLEYAKSNERMMSEELGILTHISDWAGKLPGNIARIAALLHIFRYAHDPSPWEHRISFQDMEAAIVRNRQNNPAIGRRSVLFDVNPRIFET